MRRDEGSDRESGGEREGDSEVEKRAKMREWER